MAWPTMARATLTLRAAIMEANALPGENTIRIPPGTYTLSIAGQNEDAAATGDLDVTDALTILGAGANQTIIDAAGLDRVLEVLGTSVSISGVTIRGGNVQGAGGGIRNTGMLLTSDSTIQDNVTSSSGGGLSNAAVATANVVRSTLSGNQAQEGGGIDNTGSLYISDSTVSGNIASIRAGGAFRTSREPPPL